MTPVATPIPFPGTAAGPSPWLNLIVDALGAAGTLAAAIIAVRIANRARQDAIRQREVAEALDGKLQAVAVTAEVWVDDVAEVLDYTSRTVGRAWKVRVQNLSTRPVTNLQMVVLTQYAADTREGLELQTLLPGKSWEAHTAVHAETTASSKPSWTLFFTDATGKIWRRSDAGGPWEA